MSTPVVGYTSERRNDGMAQLKSMKDEPGTARDYETIFILRPDTTNENVGTVNARLRGIVESLGGKVLKVDNWGKRKLAYQISKNDHAVYVFYTVEMPGENVQKVESILNITDEVIRFLITKPDLKAIAKADAAKAEKAQKAAERGEKQDSDEAEDE